MVSDCVTSGVWNDNHQLSGWKTLSKPTLGVAYQSFAFKKRSQLIWDSGSSHFRNSGGWRFGAVVNWDRVHYFADWGQFWQVSIRLERWKPVGKRRRQGLKKGAISGAHILRKTDGMPSGPGGLHNLREHNTRRINLVLIRGLEIVLLER